MSWHSLSNIVNCRTLLQVQSQAKFSTGDRTTVSFFTDLTKSVLTQAWFSRTNGIQERRQLSSETWRPAVRQTDANFSKKLTGSIFRTNSPKRRNVTHATRCGTAQVCNSNLCHRMNPTSWCFLIKYDYVSTPYPSLHATRPVHIILILCLISYNGRDVLFVQMKAQLSLCSIKHHAIKMYGGWW
jgi:hypothetical protein